MYVQVQINSFYFAELLFKYLNQEPQKFSKIKGKQVDLYNLRWILLQKRQKIEENNITLNSQSTNNSNFPPIWIVSILEMNEKRKAEFWELTWWIQVKRERKALDNNHEFSPNFRRVV